jgi:hypothetical protein
LSAELFLLFGYGASVTVAAKRIVLYDGNAEVSFGGIEGNGKVVVVVSLAAGAGLDEARCWVDGTEQTASGTNTNVPAWENDTLVIGARVDDSTTTAFDGGAALVAVYADALIDSEIEDGSAFWITEYGVS